MMRNRSVLLASLRETIGEFVSAVAPSTRSGTEDVLVPMLLRLAEALHFAPSRHRPELMDQFRRRTARSEPDLGPSGHDLLFRAKALFERAIWLIRGEALLLEDTPTAQLAS